MKLIFLYCLKRLFTQIPSYNEKLNSKNMVYIISHYIFIYVQNNL